MSSCWGDPVRMVVHVVNDQIFCFCSLLQIVMSQIKHKPKVCHRLVETFWLYWLVLIKHRHLSREGSIKPCCVLYINIINNNEDEPIQESREPGAVILALIGHVKDGTCCNPFTYQLLLPPLDS